VPCVVAYRDWNVLQSDHLFLATISLIISFFLLPNFSFASQFPPVRSIPRLNPIADLLDSLAILILSFTTTTTTTEASHAAARILYKADHTGRVITEHITAAAARHPLITLQENTVVTDLIVKNGVCVGVETLDGTNELASRGVVLCAGGLAGIYQHSTNPPGFNALGSSVAIAARSGAETQDLEYVQFHPTALFIPNESRFLLSEALRGEGAILRNNAGHAFAKSFHPAGELAPRDIVARGVFDEAHRTGATVKLDITHRDADWLHQRFPTIQDHVSARGLDLATDWLPITPAAHYTCGGVKTDLNGCTTLPGLYAAGEAARTGLHGGNRLASTSLLEGLVFGAAVADFVGAGKGSAVVEEAQRIVRSGEIASHAKRATQSKAPAGTPKEAEHLLQELKAVMWDHVGVVRTPSGLAHAIDELETMQDRANELFDSHPSRETAGLRDASVSGHAVAEAALANPTARGAHFVVDDEEDEEEEPMAATP
jgi:L-aspartate oxidase